MNGIPYKKPNGSTHWYLNNKRHRTDGPAVECADGTKEWWLNGFRHRTDGPAAERADGSKEWWLNGNLHREDGPAIYQPNGDKAWLVNCQYHRVDGPALEKVDGKKVWFVNDKIVYNNSEFLELEGNFIILERGIPTDEIFGDLKLTNAKLLTAKGTIFLYDNLPGMVLDL